MLGNNSGNVPHTEYTNTQNTFSPSSDETHVLSPTSHYIDRLLAETNLDSPSADPRFLHQESSYTSGFFLRTEVDKFDFDHSLKHSPSGTGSIDSLLGGSPFKSNHSSNDLPDLETTISDVSSRLHNMIDMIDGALAQGKGDNFSNEIVPVPVNNGFQGQNLLGVTKDILESVYGLQEIAARDATTHEEMMYDIDTIETVPRYGRVNIQETDIGASPIADVHDPKVTADSCSRLNNYGVILLRWPESVAQLWEEYTKIPSQWSREYLTYFLVNVRKISEIDGCEIDISRILQRRSSIQELEDKFSSGWRSTDKNFSRQINRRKKIWKAIEEGLADGVSLEDCEYVLTQFAREVGKGLSMYYKGVPFRIADRLREIRQH